MTYFVYILQSERDGTFYVGSSKDPAQRLLKHNIPHNGYTARKRPWKIVYTEVFNDKAEALIRERFIKKQKNAQFIRRLISGGSAG